VPPLRQRQHLAGGHGESANVSAHRWPGARAPRTERREREPERKTTITPGRRRTRAAREPRPRRGRTARTAGERYTISVSVADTRASAPPAPARRASRHERQRRQRQRAHEAAERETGLLDPHGQAASRGGNHSSTALPVDGLSTLKRSRQHEAREERAETARERGNEHEDTDDGLAGARVSRTPRRSVSQPAGSDMSTRRDRRRAAGADLRAAQVQRVEQEGREGRDGQHGQRPSAWQRDQHQDGPAGHPASVLRRRRPGRPGAAVVRPAARRPPRRRPRRRCRRRGVGFQRLALLQTVGVELPGPESGIRSASVSCGSLGSLAMAQPFRTDAPSRRKGGANDYDSNAGERSAPGFSRAGSKRVKGFTLPSAAVTESPRRGGARAASSGTRGSRRARSACPSTRSRPSPGARASVGGGESSVTNTAAGRGAACPCARRPRAAARRSAR